MELNKFLRGLPGILPTHTQTCMAGRETEEVSLQFRVGLEVRPHGSCVPKALTAGPTLWMEGVIQRAAKAVAETCSEPAGSVSSTLASTTQQRYSRYPTEATEMKGELLPKGQAGSEPRPCATPPLSYCFPVPAFQTVCNHLCVPITLYQSGCSRLCHSNITLYQSGWATMPTSHCISQAGPQ